MGSPLNPSRKSFKVSKGNKKIGIVAGNFKELTQKCRCKFQMDEDSITIKMKDGTEVDEEYFEVLENNEELFIGGRQSAIFQIVCRLENFLREYTQNFKVDSHLQEILQNKDICKMIQNLASLSKDTSKCQKNLKLEDPNWFEGLDTKYNTKQAVLRTSAENRMRGYFHKFKKDFDHFKERDSFEYLLSLIHQRLKNKKYNAGYFDRAAALNERLCDDMGVFLCCGEFQKDSCPHQHQINPYNSREDRVLFSTWNFDHIIEMSRSIIPAVKVALMKNASDLQIDPDYLFELMFEHHTKLSPKDTRGNLKLVHIVCHNKNPHKLECDKKRLLTKCKTSLQKKSKLS